MILRFYNSVRGKAEEYTCHDLTIEKTNHFDMHYYTTEEGLVFAVNSYFGAVFDTHDNYVGSILEVTA